MLTMIDNVLEWCGGVSRGDVTPDIIYTCWNVGPAANTLLSPLDQKFLGPDIDHISSGGADISRESNCVWVTL